MITSKAEYNDYLNRDRISYGVPTKNLLKSFLFPSHEWRFIKAMRWLEYCENVLKKRPGGGMVISKNQI